jgi:hypothetical protein
VSRRERSASAAGEGVLDELALVLGPRSLVASSEQPSSTSCSASTIGRQRGGALT